MIRKKEMEEGYISNVFLVCNTLFKRRIPPSCTLAADAFNEGPSSWYSTVVLKETPVLSSKYVRHVTSPSLARQETN